MSLCCRDVEQQKSLQAISRQTQYPNYHPSVPAQAAFHVLRSVRGVCSPIMAVCGVMRRHRYAAAYMASHEPSGLTAQLIVVSCPKCIQRHITLDAHSNCSIPV